MINGLAHRQSDTGVYKLIITFSKNRMPEESSAGSARRRTTNHSEWSQVKETVMMTRRRQGNAERVRTLSILFQPVIS